MQKYARLSEDYVVIETISADRDISEIFEPWLAEQFVKCPDYVEQQWTYDAENDEWNEPEPEPAPEPYYKTQLGKAEFLMLFTSPERVAIRAERLNDPVVDDFFDIVEICEFVDVEEQSTKDGIAYLVHKNLLTQERAEVILKGKYAQP